MPASTSPSSTLVRTDATSCSSVTGCGVSLAAVNAFVAAVPHGTVAAHSANFTPDFVTSAKLAMWSGLLGETAISSSFLANTCGVPTPSPAVVTVPIVVVLAAAKTSTGAPCVIWAASVSEPPYDGTIFTPGCACSKFVANVVNVAFSDEAANTTTVPDRAAEAGAAAEILFDELHPV